MSNNFKDCRERIQSSYNTRRKNGNKSYAKKAKDKIKPTNFSHHKQSTNQHKRHHGECSYPPIRGLITYECDKSHCKSCGIKNMFFADRDHILTSHRPNRCPNGDTKKIRIEWRFQWRNNERKNKCSNINGFDVRGSAKDFCADLITYPTEKDKKSVEKTSANGLKERIPRKQKSTAIPRSATRKYRINLYMVILFKRVSIHDLITFYFV